jgi:hypothetical protein
MADIERSNLNASEFSFQILKEDPETKARRGVIKTKRGYIDTPYFVPVATLASVRALMILQLWEYNAHWPTRIIFISVPATN